jgi:ATP-dependent helicase/nuclease subunit A
VADAWRPTAEQRAAIEVEGSAVVRAGAGCGKTAVLARRFVHLLRPGGPVAEVGHILAITFTEKAAAEMKRKIREVVAAELAGADEATRAHWVCVQRELLGAQISTIHAFCARVLRENPLEAAVDPEAVVLDEHETRTYVESTVEAALLARLRGGDTGARELLLRRSNLARGRSGGAVGLAADLLAQLARSGRDAAWLVAATRRQSERAPEQAAALRAAATRLVRTVDERLAAGGRGAGVRALAAEWTQWKERLSRLGAETPLDEFVELAELRRLLADAKLAGAVKQELADQDGRLRGALPDAYGFVRALPENARLAATVAAIADALQERKREDGVLTFDDLIAETHGVLTAHASVRDRYARRFRAILVDEFQDTDRRQAEVVHLLADAEPRPAVFVVGDESSRSTASAAPTSVMNRMREDVGRNLPLRTTSARSRRSSRS